MPRTKRRSITWQQALLLLLFGVVVGYPSFEHLDIWNKGPSPIALLKLFAGLLAFIAGCIGFLWIAVRVVNITRHFRAHCSHPVSFFNSGAIPAVFALSSAALLAPASIGMGLYPAQCSSVGSLHCRRGRHRISSPLNSSSVERNRPSHASMFGRDYLLHFGLSFILSQLPYGVALIRIWKEHDRAGIALAGFVGATRIFATLPFFAVLRPRIRSIRLLAVAERFLGLAVVSIWRSWRGAMLPCATVPLGLLISLFFGLLIYTAIAQLTLQSLWSRVRV